MSNQFDLSLVVRGESAGAVSAAAAATSGVDNLAAATKKAAGGALELTSDMAQLAASQERAGRSANDATANLVREAVAADNLGTALKRGTQAHNDNERAARANQFAVRNLGQQFGDFGLQVASGADPARAFSQQIGQMGYALGTLESGPLKSVGAFLVGPWGIALTVGAAIVAPFIEKLFQANSALEDTRKLLDTAATAADSYGAAQSLLGKVIDLTTGKLKTQNQVLIQTIRLTAQAGILRAQQDEIAARKDIATIGQTGFTETLGGALAASQGDDEGVQSSIATKGARLENIRNQFLAGQIGYDKASKQIHDIGIAAGQSADEVIKLQLRLLALGTAQNDQNANQQILDALDGKGIAKDLVPYKRDPKPKKPKKVRADTTTPREAEAIAQINAEFDDTPTLVDKAAAAVRKLDTIIADLSKRKPVGFEKLIADAQAAKGTIAEGLTRPYRDFMRAQEEGLALGALINRGHADEAVALKTILTLERQGPPLTRDQKAAILESVEAVRLQQRETDILRQKNQLYLSALGGIKNALTDATTAFVKGDLGQLLKSPGKILDVFQQFQGQKLAESLFGDVFRDLEDKVNGTSGVRRSSEQMAHSVDLVTSASNRVTAAFEAAAKAAANIPSAIQQGVAQATAPAGSPLAPGATDNPGAAANDNTPEDVVVTAAITRSQLSIVELLNEAGGKLGARIDRSLDVNLGTHLSTTFGDGFFHKLGSQLGSVLQTASIGSQLGSIIGGKNGAQIGGAAGGFAQLLGNLTGKGSQVAAFASEASPYVAAYQAIQAVSAGLGNLVAGKGKKTDPVTQSGIFGIIGGLLGGIFAKTLRGGALITSASGAPQIFGNDGATQQQAGDLAGSVQGGLKSIAEQLGGILGDFKVTIGSFKGSIRVDTSGYTGSLDTKHAPALHQFGDDAAGAVAFAISDAIADGGIKGLSEAVQRALRSSSDLDTAIKEAVKVRDLEALLGDTQGAIEKLFTTERDTAVERLRLAQAYGLDVAKTEKLNLDQREKLIADTLEKRIGSLQDFLNSVKYGDQFEGDAGTRRQAILDEIAKVQAKADAGVDGAANQLGALYQQLTSTSRDAFGTAGSEYATDRAHAIDAVTAVIQQETARINAAADAASKTTDAIYAGNALTNETNDLIAITNAKLAELLGALNFQGYYSTPGLDTGRTAREASVNY